MRIFHFAYIHRVSLQCEFVHDKEGEKDHRMYPHIVYNTRFFSTVSSLMSSKVTQIIKDFVTLLTHIGFLVTVSLFISLKIIQIKEGFSALLTCKGLLSSVNSFMFFEATGRTKGFSTYFHT
jgi:hypothetical protein